MALFSCLIVSRSKYDDPAELANTPSAASNAYNQPVVYTFFTSRLGRVGQLAAGIGLGLALALSMTVHGRAQAAAGTGSAAQDRGRILLVLPFDNRTGQPSLEWIREASAVVLSSRLASAGFAPMSRADRMYALDHLGLPPQGFHPSRASSLKLAETLDADSIIVGSYMTDGSKIVVEAQIVDVPHLRMSQTITARGDMRQMISVFNSLAWKLARQLDPGFTVAEETFAATNSGLRLDAFEQYIRGITESDQAERLRHLNSAVQLSPEFGAAWMALGRLDYANQQYEQAAIAFAKVRSSDADALEAGFYRGLSLLFSGDYPHAEEAFAGVARVLPLAEVLNNQGVSLARRGKDGIPLFRQTVAVDPNGADYHFNLAVSLKRHGDNAEALTELAQCLRLHPSDSEALAVQKYWTAPARAPKASAAHPAASVEEAEELKEQAEATLDPLERIVRNFDAAAFHQAAQMMEQMEASRLAALPPQERAQMLSVHAKDYLDRGLLLDAERLYQAALAADGKDAEAHAGLAEVRERTGDADAARKEAATSLELMPSVDAYLVLGRLNFAVHHLADAAREVDAALKIDPKSKDALDLKRKIEAKGEQK
jgi:tetratricopeptide (TPR) repeat protein